MDNLKEKLELHKKWLNDEVEGIRLDLRYANLRYANLSNANLSSADLRYANLSNANLSNANLSSADLRYANLRYADLRYCIGNNREVKSLQIGTYLISYTNDIINIGCQSHTLKDWEEFTDSKISEMDSDALEWWKLNRDIILTLARREIL